MKHATPAIIADNLVKQVDTPSKRITILHDINLKIYPGETIAFCGPSGVGKSTLLALLAGLDEPTSGKVYLLGQDLTAIKENAKSKLRAGKISFVFQGFYLLPMLTALENVVLPLEILGLQKTKETAINILARVGLENRLDHYPNQLSGGEQQRIAIARAYITNPCLLFADEITANLDEANGTLVSELLFELNQESKTTLIIVTHDLKLAAKCQRYFNIINGRLYEN